MNWGNFGYEFLYDNDSLTNCLSKRKPNVTAAIKKAGEIFFAVMGISDSSRVLRDPESKKMSMYGSNSDPLAKFIRYEQYYSKLPYSGSFSE